MYHLTRSKRKTLSIQVKEEGVFVRVPLRISQKKIEGFIQENQNWIHKQQQKIKALQKIKTQNKNHIYYFGQKYPKKFHDKKSIVFTGEAFFLPQKNPEQALKNFYKKNLEKYIDQKISEIKLEHDIPTINNIKITSAQKRWGSCTHQKNINLSYRLAQTPEFVTDYVLKHEIAHLTHMDHSARFWRLVAKYDPHYKQAEKWLKTIGKIF